MKTIKRKSFVFTIKTIILTVLILMGIQTISYAQKDTAQIKPTWWVGGTIGGNLNYYRGSTQELDNSLISYPAFHNGDGIGLYLAPTLIYHNPDKMLGIMLQVGYDSRKGKFEQITNFCNCPADLSTNLKYVTIEPSLRVAPFKGNFYVYGGPRLAFNLGKSYTYKLNASIDGLTPAEPKIKGDFSNINKSLVSMNVGIGYDILLSSKIKGDVNEAHKVKQIMLSPFVDLHPYFGQNPRSIETWNLTTLRVGVVLKFGHVNVPAKKITPVVIVVPVVVIPVVPVVIPVVPVVPIVEPIQIVGAYVLYFEFDKSNLDNQTISNLDNLINDLKNDPNIGIEIKSYADSRGSETYNMSLSGRRSKAVVDYMINKNVDVSRINSKALGETETFDKNDGKTNEVNYALNRRSNIIVVDIVSKK